VRQVRCDLPDVGVGLGRTHTIGSGRAFPSIAAKASSLPRKGADRSGRVGKVNQRWHRLGPLRAQVGPSPIRLRIYDMDVDIIVQTTLCPHRSVAMYRDLGRTPWPWAKASRATLRSCLNSLRQRPEIGLWYKAVRPHPRPRAPVPLRTWRARRAVLSLQDPIARGWTGSITGPGPAGSSNPQHYSSRNHQHSRHMPGEGSP
jgi:hypothetical protein